jgi:hypothetical protein
MKNDPASLYDHQYGIADIRKLRNTTAATAVCPYVHNRYCLITCNSNIIQSRTGIKKVYWYIVYGLMVSLHGRFVLWASGI